MKIERSNECSRSERKSKLGSNRAVPGAKIEIIPNASPSQQPSLLSTTNMRAQWRAFLRDDPALQSGFCSNVTGVDWLDRW
jgi:hypothetical protein